jgi:hypothetical protein
VPSESEGRFELIAALLMEPPAQRVVRWRMVEYSCSSGQASTPQYRDSRRPPLSPSLPGINQLLRLVAIEQWLAWRDERNANHFVTSNRVVPCIVKTSRSCWFQSWRAWATCAKPCR